MSNITNLSRVVNALRVQRLTDGFCMKTPAFVCNLVRFLHFNYSSNITSPKHRSECATRYYSCSAKQDTVRIGCASGFWGDTAASGNNDLHAHMNSPLVQPTRTQFTGLHLRDSRVVRHKLHPIRVQCTTFDQYL